MRIDVLTIFPEMFPQVLGASILKRARAKKVVQVQVHNLRDWSQDKHRKVDDRPYGGGPGMVMKPEPFFEAVDALRKSEAGSGKLEKSKKRSRKNPASGLQPPASKPYIILLSPQGEKLTQARAQKLAKQPWLVLLCGHYEGIDERVREGLADAQLSIGDYVLTCGELPAMVLIDSLVRLVPGALGHRRSSEEDSFCGNLLEYPQYTRPEAYRGLRVPEVLISGDLIRVARWRKLQALQRTVNQRPDLIK
jgi:tRNA (guanine37-N1)-methyltransferase